MSLPHTATESSPRRGKNLFSSARLLFIVLLLLLAWQAREILLLLFAGVLLALLLSRLTEAVEKHTPLPRGAAYAAVLLLLTGVIVGVGWLLAPNVSQQVDELTERLPQAIDKLSERIQEHRWARELLDQVPDREQLHDAGPQVLQQAGSVLSSAVGMIGAAVVVLATGLYLAAQLDLYRRGLLRLVPKSRRPRANEILQEVMQTLQNWLGAQFVSMAVIGVLTALGLWLLGVPLALTLGILAALLQFIPNFGPILSALPAVLLALMESPRLALWVILLYLGIQAVESYLITPLVQRRLASLPPVLVIVSQILGGVLFGFLGFALATPLLALALVLVKRLYVEDRIGDSFEKPIEA
ncbi:MAG TPA: AI-2E family transporter [Thermoanaerobaculia bacterium]|nr:AI-2E family transporter [Thermoanaerobaculia bacterium]